MRSFLAVVCTAIVAAGASLIFAPAAPAGTSWFQSVGRASATAACPDPTFGTPWQENWDPAERPWRPSWAQWMNSGTGGFTCDRTITWGQTTSYPSAGCVAYEDGYGKYVDFAGGWWLGTTVRYNDADCTSVYDPGSGPEYPANIVYAPAGFDGPALCQAAFGSRVLFPAALGTNGVWACIRPPV